MKSIIIGLHRISSLFIYGIRPDIRFRMPDIRLAGYTAEDPVRKNCFKLKHKTNKITAKHIPDPFQYVKCRSNVDCFSSRKSG